MGGVKFADFNNLESIKAQITEKTCAIIMEPVQGEGGLYPAKKEFLEGVRDLCDKKGILLIFDEVQCGMGRTGSMFAWQQYGVKPDIMAMAKALGCGVPVGAFAAKEEVAKALVPGDHGTTYGGNPFACAAVNEVFRQFEEKNIVGHVKVVGEYLHKALKGLEKKYDIVKEARGIGLMQGLELTIPAGDIILKALDKGLILITAGQNIIRFVPPLVITEANVDEMVAILDNILAEIKVSI